MASTGTLVPHRKMIANRHASRRSRNPRAETRRTVFQSPRSDEGRLIRGRPADELQRIAAKMRPQTIPDYQFIPASDPRDSRCLSSPVALFRDRNQTLERTARSNCRVPVIFLEKRRPLSETPPPPITAPCARTLFSDCRSATLKDFGPPAPPLPPSWMQPGAHRLPAIPPRLRIYWRPPQQGRALCWRSPQQGRAV